MTGNDMMVELATSEARDRWSMTRTGVDEERTYGLLDTWSNGFEDAIDVIEILTHDSTSVAAAREVLAEVTLEELARQQGLTLEEMRGYMDGLSGEGESV